MTIRPVAEGSGMGHAAMTAAVRASLLLEPKKSKPR